MKKLYFIAILSITLITLSGCPGIFGPQPTIAPTLAPTAAPGGDSYEPDDTYQQANTIYEGVSQDHNLHTTSDYDYMMFSATSGTEYTATTSSPADDLDTVLYLYSTDGTTQLDYNDDYGTGVQSQIVWTCPANGTYYLRVRGYGGDMGSYSILLSSGTSTPGPTSPPSTGESTYSGSGDEVFHIDSSGAVDLTHTLHLGSSVVDVYYVFTNTSPDTGADDPVIVSRKGPENAFDFPKPEIVENTGLAGIKGKPEITSFNNDVSDLLIEGKQSRDSGPQKDTVGATVAFKYDSYSNTVTATCRASVTDGTKVLNIYVANNCWESGGTKTYLVTQAMVDAMAGKYLIAAANNDINDWLTSIFGEEWGPHSYNNMIPDDDNITILLYDIDGDNVPSGSFVMGYFWAKDNFLDTSVSYSNERIMFYIDAVMYAYPEGGSWDITDYWPQEMISTLAHEGQHMIHFYQKAIAAGNGGYNSDTWINEMCSAVAEDLLANKILSNGPRGVDYNDPTAGSAGNTNGRLPRFNYINDYSLTEWGSQLYNYSTVYAFGAYIARDYGGTQLFQEIVQNTPLDYAAINEALTTVGYTSDDFSSLLRKWGASILLSDNTSPPASYYQYNLGAYFNSTSSGITYNLGSINLYNYTYSSQVGPNIYTTSPVGAGQHSTFESASNRLYLVGENLTGDVIHTVRMDDGVKLTVVVKE